MSKLINSIIVLAIIFTICACNGSSNNSASGDIVGTNAEGYFKGLLNFKISNLLVSESVHYKTLSVAIDGEAVKQEVHEYYLSKLYRTYGMVLKPKSDSVLYYTTIDKQNYYTTIQKKDYLNWVATLKAPIDTFNQQALEDDKPFSYVFKHLPEKQQYVLTEGEKINYLDFKNCKQAEIAFGKGNICKIIYSTDIKVPASVILATEHNQPDFLKTVALQISYRQKEKPVEADVPKWKQLLNKVVDATAQMAQYNYVLQSHSSLDEHSFELPANCTYKSYYELNEIINPPPPPGNSGGGFSSHDFD
jgi:hypothetical protein